MCELLYSNCLSDWLKCEEFSVFHSKINGTLMTKIWYIWWQLFGNKAIGTDEKVFTFQYGTFECSATGALIVCQHLLTWCQSWQIKWGKQFMLYSSGEQGSIGLFVLLCCCLSGPLLTVCTCACPRVSMSQQGASITSFFHLGKHNCLKILKDISCLSSIVMCTGWSCRPPYDQHKTNGLCMSIKCDLMAAILCSKQLQYSISYSLLQTENKRFEEVTKW